jgi:hypothetical protein
MLELLELTETQVIELTLLAGDRDFIFADPKRSEFSIMREIAEGSLPAKPSPPLVNRRSMDVFLAEGLIEASPAQSDVYVISQAGRELIASHLPSAI